ncbi:hypothetical protein LIQ07_10620 [Blautia luti]|nr:hypothetical protein [Blautia luti]
MKFLPQFSSLACILPTIFRKIFCQYSVFIGYFCCEKFWHYTASSSSFTRFNAYLPAGFNILCHAPWDGAHLKPFFFKTALTSASGFSSKIICNLIASTFSTTLNSSNSVSFVPFSLTAFKLFTLSSTLWIFALSTRFSLFSHHR